MKDYIKQLQDAYYAGESLVSDEQYDALIEQYGTGVEEGIGPKGDIAHLNPMYSLQKVYPDRGDEFPLDPRGLAKTDKLDGCAIELVYHRVGEDLWVLDHMATRGSVESGKLIPHVRHAGLKIPTSFEFDPYLPSLVKIQVTGEVCVTADNVDNARNIASGKINLDSDSEFLEAASVFGLRFYAYSIMGNDRMSICTTYDDDLVSLAEMGFLTVDHAPEHVARDGVVYRINEHALYMAHGFTSKFPRGAFAVKKDKDFVVTTLLDVEWNVGRTGKVVPTAIVEPVEIEGAVVSRATLNNPRFIELMGLYIGCKVKLIRSGEIIPCITGLYHEDEVS